MPKKIPKKNVKNNSLQTPKGTQEMAQEMSFLLRKIANPIRLLILCQISKRPKNVSELLVNIDISQSALSQHLAVLKTEDIIKDEKIGKFVFYSIKDKKTQKILGFLTKICQKK